LIAAAGDYRARYYDPTIGRFISEDPLEFGGDGTNFYVYVANSPADWVDADGFKKGRHRAHQSSGSALSFDQIANLVAKYNKSGRTTELIICLIYKESSFNPASMRKDYPKNTARGLMGITKGAAKQVESVYGDLGDPGVNIDTGTSYLKLRLQWVNGDIWGCTGWIRGRRQVRRRIIGL